MIYVIKAKKRTPLTSAFKINTNHRVMPFKSAYFITA